MVCSVWLLARVTLVATSFLSRSLCSALSASAQRSSSSSCADSASRMSFDKYPNPIVTQPRGAHSSTVIFLHGLGDTGAGWAPYMPEIISPGVKAICPSATERPVSRAGGYVMPAWFDSYDLSKGYREDSEGLAESTAYVHNLIDREIAAGIPSHQIFVGGFSQGAALALRAGLTYPQRLAGVACLSGFLLAKHTYPQDIHEANKLTPITIYHGRADGVVSFSRGMEAFTTLREHGVNVSIKAYDSLAHSASQEELSDLSDFMESVL